MPSTRQILATIITLALFLGACKKDPKITNTEEAMMQIPKGFPSIVFPLGNEFTKERWELGKKLFYDKAMSKNYTVSCASCHQANNAFSDTISFSLGDNNLVGNSNAPTLTNIAYHPYFTRAGGVPTLEMQILVPIQEHNEFNTNILDLVARFKNDIDYNKAANVAYGRDFDSYVIVRALANFERSLISGNSSFDQYNYQGKKNSLSEQQINGMNLFYSTKTNCSKCHSGFNFTNYSFENNGLFTNYADSGRMRLTKLESDRARFKVPTLRNINLTAPYMHDGSIKSLKEVILHYNLGGVYHKNKSELIKPLNLSEEEMNNLGVFLESLSDESFNNNKIFKQ